MLKGIPICKVTKKSPTFKLISPLFCSWAFRTSKPSYII